MSRADIATVAKEINMYHQRIPIKIKKLSHFPTDRDLSYSKYGDACFDLYCCNEYSVTICRNVISLIKTGIAVAVPYGMELQIRARSGLAANQGIQLVNGIGTIDAGYRGEIMIPLTRVFDGNYTIEYGDKIAQAKLAYVAQAEFAYVNELPDSERGAGGFGHTGRR